MSYDQLIEKYNRMLTAYSKLYNKVIAANERLDMLDDVIKKRENNLSQLVCSITQITNDIWNNRNSLIISYLEEDKKKFLKRYIEDKQELNVVRKERDLFIKKEILYNNRRVQILDDIYDRLERITMEVITRPEFLIIK
jgi:hypothetical protein